MKKLIAYFLVLVLSLSFCCCDNADVGETGNVSGSEAATDTDTKDSSESNTVNTSDTADTADISDTIGTIDDIIERKTPLLTLSKLKYLVARYGEDLSWKHFEGFEYAEVGSGLYIRGYTVDDSYQLLIGGGNPQVEPDYVFLIPLNVRDSRVDVRYQDVDSFLDSTMDIGNIPEDFSFSLTWGCFGISSYNSQTCKLVKTTDATNPSDYITYHQLKAWEKEYIFKMLQDLGVDDYPDEYDPGNGMSDPSATLILTVRIGGSEKTIRAENISLFYESDNEKGQAFLDACVSISNILMSTEEWKALPDYEYLYD